MPILKIARMGHPVLRTKAAQVPDPTAPEIRRLAADMLETMEDAVGAGLAAPQVHVPLRLVMFHVPAHRTTATEEPPPQGLTVLVNPVIEPLTDETELGWEGCLSVPGMIGAVPRFTRIRYRGAGLDGALIEREASGFHARVVQHECDHLDGILYPQRMTDLSLFGFADDMRKSFTELNKAEVD
jgi:peptide deformylase